MDYLDNSSSQGTSEEAEEYSALYQLVCQEKNAHLAYLHQLYPSPSVTPIAPCK